MTRPVDWLERRCTTRTLASLTLVFAVGLAVALLFVAWYFGSIGLSLGSVGYDDDARTVVMDATDRDAFARHYHDDREEGWCLYGQANETHVRIDAIVPAQTLSQGRDEIQFTCVRETAGRLFGGQSANLLGAVHSHPSYDRSYLSRKDLLLWGRTTPVVEVMGVYTQKDGVAFFTVESLGTPLSMVVTGTDAERSNQQDNETAKEAQSKAS